MGNSQQVPSQSLGDSWNERMRMIRLRRKKEAFRLSDEFRIVPRWLKILCITLYILALLIAGFTMALSPDSRPIDLRGNPPGAILAVCGLISLLAIPLSCFILMLGYVNRDARRRGMNSALWTLLVLVLSPGSMAIGFIIYFLIREPLPYACPRCNHLVGPRFNYCPNCKCDLHPSCPNCKREIAETDKFCPYCAQDLAVGEPAELPAPR
ncbi:MAG TPA: zinc ribbon domain-containing protein [Dongiaceae bacterium]|nr:zinc ribbon domain-containing protein [Dongiaceae bacterium]